MADHDLLETPLAAWHKAIGGRMVPFAGYAMPVQYPAGIMEEHRYTRASASLFDVAHMGPVLLHGDRVDALLESLTPGGFTTLGVGRQRYSMLTNAQGGIIDDLMVLRLAADRFFAVLNASRKIVDLAILRTAAPAFGVTVEPLEDHALLAIQGPAAVEAFAVLCPDAAKLRFMEGTECTVQGVSSILSRSGYTGEDGLEVAVPAAHAATLAEALSAGGVVKPAGLGARDSLRLEAGLCLYGQDLDETTTPVEAALSWAIPKRRREQGGFPGAAVIQAHLRDGPPRLRVGLRVDGRQPVRAGASLHDQDGPEIGTVTSGGFGPSAAAPLAMGYVPPSFAAPGTRLTAMVRGKPVPVIVASLPFVPHRYAR